MDLSPVETPRRPADGHTHSSHTPATRTSSSRADMTGHQREQDDDEEDDYEDEDEDDEDEDEDDEFDDYYSRPEVAQYTIVPSSSRYLGFGVSASTGGDRLLVYRKESTFSRIRSWYTPVYDYRTVDLNHRPPSKKPRFCGGRLSRPMFMCLHLVMISIVISAIMVPVMLLVVVPKIIRDKVTSFDGDSLQVERLDVTAFTTDGVSFYFKTNLPAFFPLPISVTTGPMDLQLQATLPPLNRSAPSTDIVMMTVQVPGLNFKVSEPLRLDFNSSVAFSDTDGMSKLVGRMSAPGGLSGLKVVAKTGLTITVFGITFYRGLPVEKPFDIGTVKSDFRDVVAGLPSFIKAKNLNSIILSQYKMNQLWTFFPNATSIFPLIAIESLSMTMTDLGILLTTTVTFENPSIMSLPLPPVDLGIALDETTIARVGLKGLGMQRGLNTLSMDIWVDFMDPLVTSSGEAIGAALNKTLTELLFADPSIPPNITMGCIGPIRVLPEVPIKSSKAEVVNAPGSWLSKISKELILRLPLKDVVEAINLQDLRSLLSPFSNGAGIAKLIGSASLSAQIRNSSIIAPVSLPIPKFLPLPKEVPVNFGFGASVGNPADEFDAIEADIGNLRVTSDEKDIRIFVTANVRPENSERAAKSLAGALNPALSVSGDPSTVRIGSLRAFDPATGFTYKWAEKALSKLTLNIALPPIDVGAILDAMITPARPSNATSATATASPFPIKLSDLSIAQMPSAPGFDLTGKLGIEPLVSIPQIARVEVDVGYLSLRAITPALDFSTSSLTLKEVGRIAGQTVAEVVMPVGLSLIAVGGNATTSGESTDLNVTATLAPKSPELTRAFTSLVNALLSPSYPIALLNVTSTPTSSVPETYLGITGLVMGGSPPGGVSSSDTPIITFRDLVIQISTVQVRKVVGRAVDAVVQTIVGERSALVEIREVGLEVVEGSGGGNVGVRVGGGWGRGIGLGVELGGVEMNINIDTPTRPLSKITLGPLSIPSTPSTPFTLLLNALLSRTGSSTGATDSTAKLLEGIFTSAFTETPQGLNSSFIISGVSIPPVPNAVASSRINQLEDVTMVIGSDVLNAFLLGKKEAVNFGKVGEGLVGLSQLFPTEQSIAAMGLSVTTVSLKTVSPKAIVVSIVGMIRNPSNVTVILPMGGADVSLKNIPAMSARFRETVLKAGRDEFTATIVLSFNDATAEQAADALSELVAEVTSGGNIKTPISITNLVFGDAGTPNFNDLLSKAVIDLSPITSTITGSGIGGIIKPILPVTFPATPSALVDALNLDIRSAAVRTVSRSSMSLDAPTALSVSASAGIALPFAVDVELGYLNLDVTVSGVSVFSTTFSNGLRFTKPAGESDAVIQLDNLLVGFSNSDAAQEAMGGLANSVLNRNSVGSYVAGVGRLALGTTSSEIIGTLSKVRLEVAVSSLVTLEGGSGISLSSVIFETLKGQLGAVAVAAKPGQILGADVGVSVALGFPVELNIGHIGAGISGGSLESGIPVADFALERGVNARGGGGDARLAMDVSTDIMFGESEATQDAVATLASSVFSGGQSSILYVDTLRLGSSASTSILTFSKIRLPIDIGLVISKLIPLKFPATFNSITNELGIKIGSAALETSPSSSMTLATSVDLKLPFSLTVRIGALDADVALSGSKFLEFSTTAGLNILPSGPLILDSRLAFSNADDIQNSVASLADDVFTKNTFGDHSVGLGGIRIGVSRDDTIRAFRKISVTVPLRDVISLSGEAPPNLGSILLEDMQLALAAIGVSTRPAQVLGLDAAASFKLPFPVSLRLGSVGAGFGSGGVDVAAFVIDNLRADGRDGQTTRLDLNTDMKFSETNEAQDAVASMVSGIFAGSKTSVQIGQLLIGASRSDVIRSFSKVKVPLDLSALLQKFIPIKFPASFEDLSKQLDLSLTSASVSTLPSSSMGLTAQANLKLPLDLTVSLGYLSTGVTVSNAPFVTFSTPSGLSLMNNHPLILNGNAAFSNSDVTQTAVAVLCDSVFKQGTFGDSAFGVQGLKIGVNPSDTIRALEKISVSIPLASVIKLEGTLDLGKVVTDTLKLSIASVDLATKPGKLLGLAARVGLQLPFDLSLKMDYVGAGVGAQGVGLAMAGISNLNIGGPGVGRAQALNLLTDVSFSEASEAQDAMASLVTDVLSNSPSTSIDLRSLSFGVSDSDKVQSFAKARLPLSIATLIQTILGGPIDLPTSVRTLMENTLNQPNGAGGIGLTQASVDVQSGGHIILGASALADFRLPFPLSVNIGNIAVKDINLDGVGFVDASLNGLGLRTGGALNVSAADIFIASGESIANKIATMASAYTTVGGPGKSSATLNAGKILMGSSSNDAITVFSKVNVALPVDSILGPIAKFLDSGLTSILSGLGGNVFSKTPNGGIRLNLGKDLGVTLNDCRVAFDPSSVIRAGIAGGLDFPLSIQAKVPFVGIGLGFDDTYAFDTSVTGINVAGKGQSDLKLDARIGVMDSDPLANKIAAVADAFFENDKFPGNLVFTGLRLGASQSDVIGAFSKAAIPVSLDRLASGLFGNVSRSIDILGLLKEFGFGLEGIDVSLPEAQTMRASLGVKFGYVVYFLTCLFFLTKNTLYANRNSMPFTVELPYLSTSLGLDYTNVADINFNKPFILAKGNQTTEMDINLGFPSSPSIQGAVKSFSENLYRLGWGKTTEKIALASFKLGHSSTDYIRAFSKARIGLSSASVLSLETVNFIMQQLGFPNGVGDFNDSKAVLDRIDIKGATLDLSNAGVVRVDCKALLKRIPFNLRVKFPYFFFNLKMLDQDFIKFSILDLDLAREGDDLRTNLVVEFRFFESAGLKNAITVVVGQMQDNKRVDGLLSASGVVLGQSPNGGLIDTFSQLVGELFISRITDPGNGLFSDMLGNLQLDDITLGILDEKTMAVGVVSRVKSPLPNIIANIPYLYLEATLDGKPLALLTANNVKFDNGRVVANATLEWPRDDDTVQKAADAASNVLFRRVQQSFPVVTFNKLRFGASKESAFTFVDATPIKFDLKRLIDSVNNYVQTPGQTLELTDIQTTLTEQGVHCMITGTKLPRDIPFRSLSGAGGTARVMWAPQGRQNIEAYIVDVYFKNIYFAPNEVFSFELDVVVNAKDAEPAFASILPRFIQWKPYLLGVLLGHATFTSGSPYDPNSKVFTVFNRVTVVAPDLFFYKPLIVQPKLMNPFTQGLGLRINIFFANPGPLHVELGSMGARVFDGRKEVGSVDLQINTKNNLEGGNAPMGNLVPIVVKINLSFLNILNLIFARDRYKLVWYSDRNGLQAPWLVALLDNIPEDISSQLLPIILAVLRHIEIKLGPFNIGPLPGAFNQRADEYLGLAGNNVMFGSIDAMPQAFAPMIANSSALANVVGNGTATLTANAIVTSMFVPEASATKTVTLTSWSTATAMPEVP
ncbi:hypothetical protein HDU67_007658 [Dinochytrium kinnereticum]|nr:hypothetical protein HDU67_007658 [Dinochytrium kinnereticum]